MQLQVWGVVRCGLPGARLLLSCILTEQAPEIVKAHIHTFTPLPGARLLLSGILSEQAPEIVKAYSGDFEGFDVQSDGSWACIQAVRKNAAS